MPEVLWTICAILGVLVLAYLFTRYVAGRGQGGGPSRLGKRMLTILDQVAVGKDQRLLLVRARRPRPGWAAQTAPPRPRWGSRKRCTARWSSGNNRGGHNRWMR